MKKLLFLTLFAFNSFSQINTAKPWAYWWWMGSAVSKEGIKQNLADYAKAGFGGMHIIPIYGVKGEENKFIPYLSPQWFDMLDFTVNEAKKNGLGIDMTLGTGWPFGGPQVSASDGAKSFKINDINGKLRLEIVNTNQKVKRAAPGGEGLVVDHFDKKAVENYLKPFDEYFSKKNYPVRAFYNDSYEVYGANWTNDFFQKFKKYRGYNLEEHLDILNKNEAKTDAEKRIWGDFNETISDLLYNEFNPTWTDFAKKYGKLTRNEAHGSPANILDLYAQTDMPETEFFGSKAYDIPNYRQDPLYEEKQFGRPGLLVLKLASSAANVAGKKLVTSETATWLGNHFQVALSQIKPIIDESFIGGVNHIFYHGIPYSPPNEPFPGWTFYASTNFNQNSHFWNELPLLNKYIENCQTILQNSTPDNDILVYFPMYDLWQSVGPNNKTHAINVHTILKEGMFKGDLGNLSNQLISSGYSFDFISDRQLKESTISNSKEIITQIGQKYKTIIIPKSTYISIETFNIFKNFVEKGVKIIFEDQLPTKSKGFFEFEKNDEIINEISIKLMPNISNNILQTLENQNIRKEVLSEIGLSFIRKKTKNGQLYFILNLSNKFNEGFVSLSAKANSYQIFDPITNTKSFVKSDKNREIPLQILPGQSVFIETSNQINPIKLISKNKSENKKYNIKGNWKVDFLDGKPFIPSSYNTEKLYSWANTTDTSRQYFSGKAKFSIDFSFEGSKTSTPKFINLGDVRETAKVTLNGQELGTAWSLPFRLEIPNGTLQKQNKLEIEVTNLSANRIRYMDLKGIPWKKFYDINMVDIQYKPFDASHWKPIDSGLLGPVTIEY